MEYLNDEATYLHSDDAAFIIITGCSSMESEAIPQSASGVVEQGNGVFFTSDRIYYRVGKGFGHFQHTKEMVMLFDGLQISNAKDNRSLK